MDIELSDYRVRLPEEQAIEWKEWIFDLVALDERSNTALRRELKEVDSKLKSLHKPLNEFLNGYTRQVVAWLLGNSLSKAEALCELIGDGKSPPDLWERFDALMPRERAGSGIEFDALKHLEFFVDASITRSFLRELNDWVERQQVEIDLPEPVDDERMAWSDFIAYYKALSALFEDLENPPRFSFDTRLLHRAQFPRVVAKMHLATDLCRQRMSNLLRSDELHIRSQSDERNSDDTLALNIYVHPITKDNIRTWIERLHELERLSDAQQKRALVFFDALTLEALNRLSPSHLLYALDDARAELLANDPRGFQQQRVHWVRRELVEAAETSAPQVKDWLRETSSVFLGWITHAGTLQGTLSRDDLNTALGVKASRNELVEREALEQGLHAYFRANTPGEYVQAKREAMLLLPNKLKGMLDDAKLISTGLYNALSPGLLRLAELEVTLHLKPEQLNNIDILGNEDLIAETVRLARAEELDNWCKSALAVDDYQHSSALQAVLRGLSLRPKVPQKMDRALLRRLWASCIWARLFALHSHVHNDKYHPINEEFASDKLRDLLPILDGENDSLSQLKAYVSEHTLEAVEKWRKSAPEQSDEFLNDQLTRFAPFQVWPQVDDEALEQVLWQWGEPGYDYRILFHFADNGVCAARRFMLASPFGIRLREDFDHARHLSWWRELASKAPLKNGEASRFYHTFYRIFLVYIDSQSSTLRDSLNKTLLHKELKTPLPNDITHALTCIELGAVPSIKWIVQPEWNERLQYSDLGYSRANLILALAEILQNKEFLRNIIAFDPTTSSDLSEKTLFKYVTPKETRARFPTLEQLAEIRHHALLALARLGEAAPLRESIKERWKIQSPHLAQGMRSKRQADPTLRFEPHELYLERRKWAEENDNHTLKDWCENLCIFKIDRLIGDLSGFAERAWTHLDAQQRKWLLQEIPREQMKDPWWSRRLELGLNAQLEILRTHGSPREQRAIAREILQTLDPKDYNNRLRKWLQFWGKARPSIKVIHKDIEAFRESLPVAKLSSEQMRICSDLLVVAQRPEDIVRWFPHIVEAKLLEWFLSNERDETIQRLRNSGPNQKIRREPEYVNSVKLEFPDIKRALRKLDRSQLIDLQERLSALKNRLYEDVCEQSTNNKLDQDIVTLERRIEDALIVMAKYVEFHATWDELNSPTLKGYSDAKKQLYLLLDADEDEDEVTYRYWTIDKIFEKLSPNDHIKLIKEIVSRPETLKLPMALWELLRYLDASSLSNSRLDKIVNTLFNEAFPNFQESFTRDEQSRRSRELSADLIQTLEELRRTPLRRRIQQYLKDADL